jgi:chromosome partitioning protein
MTKIISVIQEKGGTGKSTIATNLAGMANKNKRVALIDCDMPQGTSASWSAMRLQETPHCLTARIAKTYQDLAVLVEELTKDHDLIVIDAPPRIAETTKIALVLSNLAVIPLGASAVEIWAMTDLIKTIEAAKKIKPNVQSRILWNRFRASTNSAKELSKTVSNELKIKQLNTKIGYRVAYSEALARGLTAIEWNDKQAKNEMILLGKELNQILKTELWNRK